MFCFSHGSYKTYEQVSGVDNSYVVQKTSKPTKHRKAANMTGRIGTRGTGSGSSTPTLTKRQILMSTLQEMLQKEVIINTEEMEKVDIDKKIELLTQAIMNVNNKFAKVNEMINDSDDGLHPRLKEEEDRIVALLEENKTLRKQLDVSIGLISKQDLELSTLRDRLTKLTAKSMENNIVIGGLIEEIDESPKEIVKEFLSDKMMLEFNNDHIMVAHRIGEPTGDESRPRFMIARFHPELKELVLSNKKKLSGKKNSKKRYYSVKKQIPDEWSEQSRELRTAVKKAHQVNHDKGEYDEKDKIEVRKRVLYINRVPQKKILCVPKPMDLFPEKPEQDKIERMKLYSSTPQIEGSSSFTAHVIKTQSLTEVRRAYVKVKQIHAQSPHVMAAFIVKNSEGNQDDREFGASSRMLEYLQSNNYANVAVFVCRDFDGIHIGPKRHTLIQNAMQEALAKAIQK